MADMDRKTVTTLMALGLFILFFGYYWFTSSALPRVAGPDWRSNTEAGRFIYENLRLPVLPDDEAALHFTPHGGTRSLRPPLSFMVSAGMAHVLSFTSGDLQMRLRKGSALLCALAVALAFHALATYFSSLRAGVLGAFLIGLMPQFTFIASYNNDDSGAIFSATLMLAVLVRIYRHGPGLANAVLLGLAAGLIVLSKMSAWLMMPFVLLFLLLFVRAPARELFRYAMLAAVVFVASGGWWLLFNVYHYGIGDPLAMGVMRDLIATHRRLPPGLGVGFAAHGIGFHELLIENYRNFLGETARSTIGNLDWLRLRVGPWQYSLYLSLLYAAVFYWLARVTAWPVRRLAGGHRDREADRQLMFETLLAGVVVFQVVMYTWTNIYNDIQIQGKYILPVFLAILLVSFSALAWLGRGAMRLSQWLLQRYPALSHIFRRSNLLFIGGMLVVVLVHVDAWFNYVIPFYRPPAYDMKLGEFKPVNLSPALHGPSHGLDFNYLNGMVEYVPVADDPRVNLGAEVCRRIGRSALLRLTLQAEADDTLQLFIDEGRGYTGRHSFTANYRQGDNVLLLLLSNAQCRRIRLDPAMGRTRVLLKRFEIAPVIVRPRAENRP